MSGSPELRCENVTVRFGALIAVDRVSLDFPGRGLHSIIGPNGAGKTTLINVLSGRQLPKEGRVLLGGRDVTARSAFERARLGIGRSFQLTRIFPTLTVFENLRLGAQARAFRVQPFWRAVEGFAVLSDAASRVVAEIGLEHLRDRAADQLSHGDQRALEIGIALMTEPDILLLDEPLAGVGEHEIAGTTALIRRIARGRTIVLIEHNIDVVMDVSDRIIVMNQGAVLAIGPPDEIRRDVAVRAAYLGDEHAVA